MPDNLGARQNCLTWRVTNLAKKILHVPHVSHHWDILLLISTYVHPTMPPVIDRTNPIEIKNIHDCLWPDLPHIMGTEGLRIIMETQEENASLDDWYLVWESHHVVCREKINNQLFNLVVLEKSSHAIEPIRSATLLSSKLDFWHDHGTSSLERAHWCLLR